jgi:hypothetical protein
MVGSASEFDALFRRPSREDLVREAIAVTTTPPSGGEWPEFILCLAPELIDVSCTAPPDALTLEAIVGSSWEIEKTQDRQRYGWWRGDPGAPEGVRQAMARDRAAEHALYDHEETLRRSAERRERARAALAEPARRLAGRG